MPASGARSWNVSQLEQAPAENGRALLGISCPSVSLCIAFDDNGNVLTATRPLSGAGAWTKTNVGLAPVAESCPTIELCAFVDGSGGDVITSTNLTGGARAWQTAHLTDAGLYGISCATAPVCVAINQAYEVASSINPTGGAAAWTTTVFPGGFKWGGPHAGEVNGPGPLSCVAGPLCVMIDTYGHEFVSSSPTSGTDSWAIKSAGVTNPTVLTCVTTTTCVTISDAGTTVLNPLAGTSQTTHPGGLALRPNSISCPSATLCVVVGEGGQAQIGEPPLPPIRKMRTALINAIVTARASRRVRTLLANDGERIRFNAPNAGRLDIAWHLNPNRGGHSKRWLIATATTSFPDRGAAQVNIRLTPAGRTLLAGARQLRVTALGTYTPAAGSAITATKSFPLSS